MFKSCALSVERGSKFCLLNSFLYTNHGHESLGLTNKPVFFQPFAAFFARLVNGYSTIAVQKFDLLESTFPQYPHSLLVLPLGKLKE